MLTFNSITIAGFVGNAPKTSRDRDGQLSFAAFDVATTERWKDGKGHDQERTTWFHVVCNGTTARYVAGHVMKGDPVFVLGTVSDKEWHDKESGEVRKSKEVRAHRVIDPTKRGAKAMDDAANQMRDGNGGGS